MTGPELYLPNPYTDDTPAQDVVSDSEPSLFAMRTWSAEVSWANGQVSNPTQDWTNLCQSFARQAVGAAAWAPSAWDAWQATPTSRRILSRPDANSSGIAYFGSRYPGHAVPLDGTMCWSNDIKRRGKIDRVPWDTFISAWGMPYLGRIMVTPSGTCPSKSTSGSGSGDVALTDAEITKIANAVWAKAVTSSWDGVSKNALTLLNQANFYAIQAGFIGTTPAGATSNKNSPTVAKRIYDAAVANGGPGSPGGVGAHTHETGQPKL